MSTTTEAPSRPRPTVAMPTTPPVRKATRMAGSRPSSRAAAATRTFARTASDMPRNPMDAEKPAPTRKNTERQMRSEVSSAGSSSSRRNATTANTPRVLNWRPRNADAPSSTAWAMAFMFCVPSPAARTWARNTNAMTSATSAMAPTTRTRLRLPPERSTDVALPTSKETRDMRILSMRALPPSDEFDHRPRASGGQRSGRAPGPDPTNGSAVYKDGTPPHETGRLTDRVAGRPQAVSRRSAAPGHLERGGPLPLGHGQVLGDAPQQGPRVETDVLEAGLVGLDAPGHGHGERRGRPDLDLAVLGRGGGRLLGPDHHRTVLADREPDLLDEGVRAVRPPRHGRRDPRKGGAGPARRPPRGRRHEPHRAPQGGVTCDRDRDVTGAVGGRVPHRLSGRRARGVGHEVASLCEE